MKQLWFIVCLVFVGTFISAQKIDIADARTKTSGAVVTIEGVVLNGKETSELRYMQDATAGIALYDGLAGSKKIQFLETGDRVQITGEITTYKGLVEINKILAVKYISPNNPLPTPKPIAISDMNKQYQSELVRISCAEIETSYNYFSSGSYSLNGRTGITKLLIPQNSTAVGEAIPKTNVDIIGINHYANESFVLIRKATDIINADCLSFTQRPTILDQDLKQVDFKWITNKVANHKIELRDEGQSIVYTSLEEQTNQVDLKLENLNPGTVYYMDLLVYLSDDTLKLLDYPFVTKSASSGVIDVYFNTPVDPSYSTGAYAKGETDDVFLERLFQDIDNAKISIDIAMYNCNKTNIVNRLIDAHNRGVVVRYITDDQTKNTVFNNLTPPFGLYPGNKGNGLMHNKFIVIDKSSNDALVYMGAMNFTGSQIASDPNHMLVIQDQSLAKAYTIEFNEMWGSSGPYPDIQQARFGADKTDNTPHVFEIGDTKAELYFSPSDNTSRRIIEQINQSTSRIDIALLTMTYNAIGSALVRQFKNQVDVRLIVENYDDTGSEYNYLITNGIPVSKHNPSPIFHHKYAIFDEGTDNARLLSGSHNWTNKAETINDENTMIFYSQDLANIFRQEYERHWTKLTDLKSVETTSLTLIPNPSADFVRCEACNHKQHYVLFDINGNTLASGIANEDISLNSLAAGVYFVKISDADSQSIHRVVKL